MKYLLLFTLCTALFTSIYAQENRWSVSAENTLSFANVTNSPYGFSRNDTAFQTAYNAFLRTEYKLNNRFSVTIGFGYMQTREFARIFPVSDLPTELLRINSNKSHHYVVAPIGFKYSFGSFFIRPEIGIGYNTANTSIDEYYYQFEPNIITTYKQKNKDSHNFDEVSKFTYPLFLTIGTEIPVSSFRVILGAQGFYTLNTIGEKPFNQRHAYGLGTTVGVKF